MIGAVLSPAEAKALDDLEHDCDLIGRRPLPCEIEWALTRLASGTICGRFAYEPADRNQRLRRPRLPSRI